MWGIVGRVTVAATIHSGELCCSRAGGSTLPGTSAKPCSAVDAGCFPGRLRIDGIAPAFGDERFAGCAPDRPFALDAFEASGCLALGCGAVDRADGADLEHVAFGGGEAEH